MPETELHKAARDGDKDEVEHLLSTGLDVNEKGAQGADSAIAKLFLASRRSTAHALRVIAISLTSHCRHPPSAQVELPSTGRLEVVLLSVQRS